MLVRTCPTKLAVVRPNTESVFEQFRNSEISDSDWHLYVPHRRLLLKLQAIGVDGPLLNWIEAFLSDRRQRVGIEGAYSGWAHVTSGIPQGSVLGPILFLVYINDLPDVVRCTAKLFADDTKVYRSVASDKDQELLQSDINALEACTVKWQLPFNARKCKLMHQGYTNQTFRYHMAEE